MQEKNNSKHFCILIFTEYIGKVILFKLAAAILFIVSLIMF